MGRQFFFSVGITSLMLFAVLTLGGVKAQEKFAASVSFDTGGVRARSVYLILAYDDTQLVDAQITQVLELPASWNTAWHSPKPGEIRFLAFTLDPDRQTRAFREEETVLVIIFPDGTASFAEVSGVEVFDSWNKAIEASVHVTR